MSCSIFILKLFGFTRVVPILSLWHGIAGADESIDQITKEAAYIRQTQVEINDTLKEIKLSPSMHGLHYVVLQT